MPIYKNFPREKEKPANKLATKLDHTYHWLELNWRAVLAGIGAVAVVAAIVLVAASYSGSRDEKARNMFYKAGLLVQGSAEYVAAMEELVGKYPGSGVAQVARLKLGDVWAGKGDYKKAVDVLMPLQKASDPAIRILALHNIASAKLANGDKKDAVSFYLKAYSDSKNPLKALSYFNAGLASEEAGDADGAKKIFEELSKEETAFSTPEIREKSKERLLWLAIKTK